MRSRHAFCTIIRQQVVVVWLSSFTDNRITWFDWAVFVAAATDVGCFSDCYASEILHLMELFASAVMDNSIGQYIRQLPVVVLAIITIILSILSTSSWQTLAIAQHCTFTTSYLSNIIHLRQHALAYVESEAEVHAQTLGAHIAITITVWKACT